MLLNSVDIEDGQLSTTSTIHQLTSTITSSSVTMPGTLSGSPPSSVTSHITDKCTKESTTPPSSPNIGGPLGAPQFSMEKTSEALDLQIDYWLVQSKESTKESKKSAESGSKCSLKTTFRSLQVSHLPASGEHVSSTSHLLTLNYVTKEKKQKIIRLGKKKEKEKDIDVKPQVVEGINRLICSTKSQPSQLRVNIDGVEWHGVKFFQLSSQWQTHIKHFPIGLFSQRETGF
ncbi:PACS1 (predicted) [Pycnogonum litorale]